MPPICPTTTINVSNYATNITADAATSKYFITLRTGWDSIINTNNIVVQANLTAFTQALLIATAPPLSAADLNNLKMGRSQSETSAPSYGTHAKFLRDFIQQEYCYYYTRYTWAISTMFNTATTSGATISEALKTNTAILNKKINTILAVLGEIVNQRTLSIKGYIDSNDGLNSLNSDLSTARTRLRENSEKLEKQDLAADIQSSMIDYSLEKNESSRNMLAIYGFMNIVAVGMLFYLYTHVKQ